MPTYAQLQAEPVWRAQFTPPALQRFAERLSKHYGVPVWTVGSNNHVYGRHRSRDWCLTSAFCTNRSYGTRDDRDKRGNGSWYRAFDLALQGQPLWEVCRRLDTAVRAGQLPGLAEWFGTFDGRTVVGWYEGRPSSSDTSHLTHLHGGVWTEVADDSAVMDQLFAVITGQPTQEDDVKFTVREPNGSIWLCDFISRRAVRTVDEWKRLLAWGADGRAGKIVHLGDLPASESIGWYGARIDDAGTVTVQLDDAQVAKLLAEVKAAAEAGAQAGAPTPDEIADELRDRLAG